MELKEMINEIELVYREIGGRVVSSYPKDTVIMRFFKISPREDMLCLVTLELLISSMVNEENFGIGLTTSCAKSFSENEAPPISHNELFVESDFVYTDNRIIASSGNILFFPLEEESVKRTLQQLKDFILSQVPKIDGLLKGLLESQEKNE